MTPFQPRQLSSRERLDWLRLIRSENVGPITFYQLLRRFGSAEEALKALPDLARRGGLTRPIRMYPIEAAERELEAIKSAGGVLVAFGEPDYPPALAALEDAPPVLTMKGNLHLGRRQLCAIVGARNASALGYRFAQKLAKEIGQAGFGIVSGLARGIDKAAHEGSLATGTIAVQSGGIDVVYPQENRDLYDKIAAAGLLVAELAAGAEPKPQNFPRRNRLISGLSLGVVVVEAARRSGSLITARFALEQGREVFAVPGSPLDPRAEGTNDLIRQGATLVQTADDVLAVLAPLTRKPLEAPEPPRPVPPPALFGEADLRPVRAAIAEKLGPSAVPVDELIRQTRAAPALVLTVLLELELAGRLQRHPGNGVSAL
jgi:DNA processing protein